jgi:hypothetical protein
MTIEEFTQLEECEQIEICHDHGPYIGDRYEGTVRIQLYAIGDFYAENFTDEIYFKGVKAFKSLDRLEPYLELIDLNDL